VDAPDLASMGDAVARATLTGGGALEVKQANLSRAHASIKAQPRAACCLSAPARNLPSSAAPSLRSRGRLAPSAASAWGLQSARERTRCRRCTRGCSRCCSSSWTAGRRSTPTTPAGSCCSRCAPRAGTPSWRAPLASPRALPPADKHARASRARCASARQLVRSCCMLWRMLHAEGRQSLRVLPCICRLRLLPCMCCLRVLLRVADSQINTAVRVEAEQEPRARAGRLLHGVPLLRVPGPRAPARVAGAGSAAAPAQRRRPRAAAGRARGRARVRRARRHRAPSPDAPEGCA